MSERVVMIVNPVSGGSRNADLVAAICGRLRRLGRDVQVLRTARRGDARNYAARLDTDLKVVIAVGGDGTVNEVVDGLIHHPIPVLIVPRGTENLLANVLGTSTNPDWVAAAAIRPHVVSYDVGVANGRRFLCVAGVGFDGEVIRRLEERRRGHIGHLTYFWPIWRTFGEYKFPPMRVELDGACVFEGRCLAFVGLIDRYAMGLRILRDAKPDDGLFDVCIYACDSQPRLIEHSVMTLFRRHVERPGVIYRRAKHVCITAATNLPIEIDGESAGVTPVDFSILPGTARFVAAPAV